MINLGLGIILGLVLGSFFKCLADRSLSENAFTGRSYCPDCGHSLRWYDLFPVISYLSTLGHCRYCQKKVPLEYPLFEIISGVIIGGLFYLQMPNWWLVFNEITLLSVIITLLKSLFIGVLLAFVVTDLKAGILPDRLTYPAIKLSLFSLIVITIYQFIWPITITPLPWWIQSFNFPEWSQSLAAAIYQPFLVNVIAGLSLGGFFASLIIVTKGKGLGGGDFKLGILMGLVLGIPGTIIALMISFLTGSITGIGLILIGKKHFGQTIPFGPFLVLGSLITLFWGPEIWYWYLHLHF